MTKKLTIVMLILCLIVIQSQISVFASDSTNQYNLDDLTKAVLVNDLALVEEIISDTNLDLNQKDSNGKYPLEMVLVMDNCDMARILLEAGADPHLKTKNGKSIYELAMASDNKVLKEIFANYK